MLANFMEEHPLPKYIEKHKIKYLSKQLFEALQQPADKLLTSLKNEHAEDAEITGLLHLSAVGMEHFFRLNMQISDLDEVRKNTLIAQLNSLLISYGIETMDIKIYE
jgi:hypothetical protein